MDADHYKYRISWSSDDEALVGTVAEFPSLSWLADSQVDEFQGIRTLVAGVLDDMKNTGGPAHYSKAGRQTEPPHVPGPQRPPGKAGRSPPPRPPPQPQAPTPRKDQRTQPALWDAPEIKHESPQAKSRCGCQRLQVKGMGPSAISRQETGAEWVRKVRNTRPGSRPFSRCQSQ